MIQVQQYIDRNGHNPFERWYFTLGENTRTRITLSLDRLSRGGTTAKGVGGGVMEIRLDFGPGYRVYFGRDGDTLVIVLGGGTKKRQDVDIVAAQKLWREYKQRKQEE